jgi:hypothetical protein
MKLLGEGVDNSWKEEHLTMLAESEGTKGRKKAIEGGGPTRGYGITVIPEALEDIADSLSDYGEYEIILSGDFQINKWILSARGRMSAKVDGQLKGIRTLMQANSETMEIKFIYKEIKKVDYLSFTDQQLFLDAIDKYTFNQGKFKTDKPGMPNNISKWQPSSRSVLIAADVTLI